MRNMLAMLAVLTASIVHAQTQTAAGVPAIAVDASGNQVILKPGHPSLQAWHISRASKVPPPADNQTTPERVALGRQLFHDPRVSTHGRTSCASCHDASRGFGDGVPGSIRFMGEVMARNSPSVFDTVFRPLLMWDGRNRTLEDQALSSQSLTGSMAAGTIEAGLTTKENPHPEIVNAGAARIRGLKEYRDQFSAAYPNEPINQATIAKALAAYERNMVSEGTRFDRFVAGEPTLSAQEIDGLRVFLDRSKGNCAICHQAPTFSDNGFHNIGVASKDTGRYDPKSSDPRRRIESLRGAFLTPQLRQVEHTQPYFHDGSARTLLDVVKHYNRGGVDTSNLSPNMRTLQLTDQEMDNLVSFMKTLTSPPEVYEKHDRPQLPRR